MRVYVPLCALCLCFGQSESSAQITRTRTVSKLDAKVVTRLEGPGGSVGLGDTLQQAKKAYPAPNGAHVLGTANFAIFSREGWSWATENPPKAFEVSLKNGKVVGIALTVG